MMSKFGAIEKVFIPESIDNARKNKIAIVRFKINSNSDRAIEEGYVSINYSEVKIERALKKNQPMREPYRERTDRPFEQRGERTYGGDRGGRGGGQYGDRGDRGEPRTENKPDDFRRRDAK